VKQKWRTGSPRFSSDRPSGVSCALSAITHVQRCHGMLGSRSRRTRRLDHSDLGAVVGHESRPAHLIVAAVPLRVADKALLEVAGIERAEDLGPIVDRLVEVVHQPADTVVEALAGAFRVDPEERTVRWAIAESPQSGKMTKVAVPAGTGAERSCSR
jgi:hypothetical protein